MPDKVPRDLLPTIDPSPAKDPPETVGVPECQQSAPTTEPSAKHARKGATSDPPKIAGYEITREIARGGMGRVLEGREQALDREVALKVLLPGADAARFLTESRITARLPHPNIPPIYALGTLADGSPYLAMKLVQGLTLAEELQARASVDAGLPKFVQIFEQIAQAVGYAHARGIIHRDLKPANVMVGPFGEVQVMDWGLAKDLASPAGEVASEALSPAAGDTGQAGVGEQTEFGAVMGTPAYMAPEQARGERVDERADVFSLGGILASILTGQAVFSGQSVLETIRQAAAGDVSPAMERIEHCRADPQLAEIAKRCLAPAAAQRPASGLEVAQLVAAYRQGVEERLQAARAEQAALRVQEAENRKRRRLVQLAGGIVAAVLLVGIAGTTLGMLAAWRQTGLANHRKLQAEAAEKIAADRADGEQRARLDAQAHQAKAEAAARAEKTANQQAQARLNQIQKGMAILGAIFKDLNPRQAEKDGKLLLTLLGERLDKVSAELEGSAIGDPLAVARLQLTLVLSHLGLGNHEKALLLCQKARQTLEKELGPDNHDTLIAMNSLAQCLVAAGKYEEALPLLEQSASGFEKALGPNHPDAILARGNLAAGYKYAGQTAASIERLEAALEAARSRFGPRHPTTLSGMNNLAVAYCDAGRLDEAIKLYEETVAARREQLGDRHIETLGTLHLLAGGYRQMGKNSQSIPLAEEALAGLLATVGHDHPTTIAAKETLGECQRDATQFAKALTLFKEVHASRVEKLGLDHPETLKSANNLAVCHNAMGQVADSLALLEASDRAILARHGPNHPNALQSKNNLASAYQLAGQPEKALSLLEQAARDSKQQNGPRSPVAVKCATNLAAIYQEAGQFDKALSLCEEILPESKALYGDDHSQTLSILAMLGNAHRGKGEFAKALPLLEQVHAAKNTALGPNHPDVYNAKQGLGALHQSMRRPDLALPFYQQAAEGRKSVLGEDHPDTLVSMNSLGECYRLLGHLAQAVPLLEQAYAARKAKLGADHPATLQSLGSMARAYFAQKNFDRALPLLQEAYDGSKAKLGPDHPDTMSNLNNLAAGYYMTGERDKALPLLEESVRLSREKRGSNHPETLAYLKNLATAHLEAKRSVEALKLFSDFVAGQRQVYGGESPQLTAWLEAVSSDLLRAGQFEAAELYLRECLAIRRKTEPDSWTPFSAQVLLGKSLVGQRKLDEAESMLLGGYQGLKAHEKTLPAAAAARIPEVLDQLIELYRALGKQTEVEKWKTERALYPAAQGAAAANVK